MCLCHVIFSLVSLVITVYRLTCCLSSVGLRVPSSCELVVGGEPQCWSEGSCLLFDDSFLHRAFHEGEREMAVCVEGVKGVAFFYPGCVCVFVLL